MIDPIKSPYPREQLPAKHPLTLLSFFDLSAYLCAMAFCLFVTWNIRDNVRAMSSNPWDLIFPLACTVFFALGVVVVSPFAYRIQGAVAWGATATVLVTAILYLGQWNVPFQLVVVTIAVAALPWRAGVFAWRRAKSLEQKRAMRALQANQQDNQLP